MIPQSYEEWKNCIVNDCKIDLTKAFAKKRLDVFEDKNHPETRKFAELYGKPYLETIVYWYKRYYNE